MSTIANSLASSKKLLAFFNANTAGAVVNKFADRKTAERRCTLLAEELQAEKFSDDQIAAAIAAGTKLEHAQDTDDDDDVDHSASNAAIAKIAQPVQRSFTELAEHKYAQGSLRAKLSDEMAQQQPITPRPKKADGKAPAAPRVIINCVRATFAGTSQCQAGSIRAQVLKAVQDAHATEKQTITVAELDKLLSITSRGYLQKLLEKGHIEVVEVQSSIEGAK